MKKKTDKIQRSHQPRLFHHVLNTIFPRPHNNYHPHLISRYGFVAIAMLASVGFFLAGSQQRSVLGAEPAVTPAGLLQSVNDERRRDGDRELVYDTKLAAAALAKGQHMFAEQYWAHNSPTGVTPWKWIQDQGYAYTYAGENLAKNFLSAESTVDAWMASPSHRDNMLRDYYRDAGFAVVDGQLDGRPATIIVALFGAPMTRDSSVAGVTTSPQVGTELGLFTRAGVGIQAMNPALLGAVAISIVAMFVALLTFATTHMNLFGRNMARTVSAVESQAYWHQHHSISKLIGLMAFVTLALLIVSVGQL